MDPLNLFRFPFAAYDSNLHEGYLTHYYPYDATRKGILFLSQWYNESHSSEILNFKTGEDSRISFWIVPFLNLLHHAMTIEQASSAILVPVPPSTLSRNRILRFCAELCAMQPQLQTHELIKRATPKKKNSHLSLEETIATLKVCHTIQSDLDSTAIILVDDIKTTGTTLNACQEVLIRGGQKAKSFIKLTLGVTQNPSEFRRIPPSAMLSG